MNGEYLSASLYLWQSEKIVSIGEGTSSEKSGDKVHCFSILGDEALFPWEKDIAGTTSMIIINRFLFISANIGNN